MTLALHHASDTLPERFSGVFVPATCSNCGADLLPVTTGRPQAGTFAAAILRCSTAGCHRLYEVMVYLRPTGHHTRYDVMDAHRRNRGVNA